MIDILLLAGIALMALSLLVAVVALLRTEPPRLAAGMFLLGIMALLLAAWLDPDPFRVQHVAGAWARLTAGQVPR